MELTTPIETLIGIAGEKKARPLILVPNAISESFAISFQFPKIDEAACEEAKRELKEAKKAYEIAFQKNEIAYERAEKACKIAEDFNKTYAVTCEGEYELAYEAAIRAFPMALRTDKKLEEVKRKLNEAERKLEEAEGMSRIFYRPANFVIAGTGAVFCRFIDTGHSLIFADDRLSLLRYRLNFLKLLRYHLNSPNLLCYSPILLCYSPILLGSFLNSLNDWSDSLNDLNRLDEIVLQTAISYSSQLEIIRDLLIENIPNRLNSLDEIVPQSVTTSNSPLEIIPDRLNFLTVLQPTTLQKLVSLYRSLLVRKNEYLDTKLKNKVVKNYFSRTLKRIAEGINGKHLLIQISKYLLGTETSMKQYQPLLT